MTDLVQAIAWFVAQHSDLVSVMLYAFALWVGIKVGRFAVGWSARIGMGLAALSLWWLQASAESGMAGVLNHPGSWAALGAVYVVGLWAYQWSEWP